MEIIVKTERYTAEELQTAINAAVGHILCLVLGSGQPHTYRMMVKDPSNAFLAKGFLRHMGVEYEDAP